MRRFVSLSVVSAVLAIGSREVVAQVREGQRWSVLTGRTVGNNENFLHVQVGWPGVSGTLIHGTSPVVDLGGIFTFNYGLEGDVDDVEPGIKLQALARIMLSDSGKFNLGLNFAPGPLLYFGHSRTLFGFIIPVGLVFGIPASPDFNISLGADIPFWFYVNQGGGAVIPILFGGGVEYFIDRTIAVTFKTRMGPEIFTSSGSRTVCIFLGPIGGRCGQFGGGGYTDFALEALIGLAFRL